MKLTINNVMKTSNNEVLTNTPSILYNTPTLHPVLLHRELYLWPMAAWVFSWFQLWATLRKCLKSKVVSLYTILGVELQKEKSISKSQPPSD